MLLLWFFIHFIMLLVQTYTFETHYNLLQCACLNSSSNILLFTSPNPIKEHSVQELKVESLQSKVISYYNLQDS